MNPTTPAALMMIAAGALASAQGLVHKADSPVAGQYIVVVDDDALLPATGMLAKDADIAELAGAVARERRVDVRKAFGHALRGFVARMSEDEAAALATEPWVKLVEQDGIVEVAGTQVEPPSWGLDRIDQRTAPLDGSYSFNNGGAGVDVYVVDSGIRSTHVEFGGRVDTVNAFTAVNDGYGTEDPFGHGTMVAGIIGSATYGVAKDVTLHPVRVVDASGQATISGLVGGIDWITARFAADATTTTTTKKKGRTSTTTTTTSRRPAVVNISMISGSSPTIDAAVQNSIAAGLLYVVAAGNSAFDACYYSPARVPAALTVGATSSADTVWTYSNGGSCVDLFAPGVQVWTTLSRTDTDATSTSGTSASAPHVAGAAALFLAANPTASPSEVAGAILATASAGALAALPASSPNLLLYSAELGLDTPPVADFTVKYGSRRSVTFNASPSTDAQGIASYAWDFGDGSSASGVKVSYRFPSSGSTYLVTLTVTDTAGQRTSVTQPVTF